MLRHILPGFQSSDKEEIRHVYRGRLLKKYMWERSVTALDRGGGVEMQIFRVGIFFQVQTPKSSIAYVGTIQISLFFSYNLTCKNFSF